METVKRVYKIENFRDDFTAIVRKELAMSGKDCTDLNGEFRNDHEYYNFRDIVKGTKTSCSMTFLEKILKLIGKQISVTVEVCDK